MIPANYTVIQYIADPARSEALNVGVAVWNDRNYRLAVDRAATQRALRSNPRIASEVVEEIARLVDDKFAAEGSFQPSNVERLIGTQRGFPILFSEARFTAIPNDDVQALDETLDRLLGRIVRLKHASRATSHDAIARLTKSIKPFVTQQLLTSHYRFAQSKSGVTREVDYFADLNQRLALDVIDLSAKRQRTIGLRADAEAYKIEDIRTANDVNCIVFCAVPGEEEFTLPVSSAIKVIESSGATVKTDIPETLEAVQLALRAS